MQVIQLQHLLPVTPLYLTLGTTLIASQRHSLTHTQLVSWLWLHMEQKWGIHICWMLHEDTEWASMKSEKVLGAYCTWVSPGQQHEVSKSFTSRSVALEQHQNDPLRGCQSPGQWLKSRKGFYKHHKLWLLLVKTSPINVLIGFAYVSCVPMILSCATFC